MSNTTWPLNLNLSNFKYVNILVTSTSANSVFISATRGGASTTSIFNVPTSTTNGTGVNNYLVTNIIAATYLNGVSTNQGTAYSQKNVLLLQNNTFALEALNNASYKSFVPGLFNQFGLVSNIIVAMIAYGNTDNLSLNDNDLVTQWPHQINSNMLTISDAMTYSVRQLGTAADTSSNFANIAEWRWLYPQRSRCVTPTTLNIISIIGPTITPANNIAYPSGTFRWDILRYDFFNSGIYETRNERNTIANVNNEDLFENDVFNLIYDNVAAPGCILLSMKIPINYNDGTGSVNKENQNTSIRVLNQSYDKNNITYPTVFRVGFEWINDFINAMSLCTPLNSNQKVLLFGGNLEITLLNIKNSYLGCKRLYMWRLTHDLLISRLNNNSGIITPVTSISSDGILTTNSVPGIYLCLLNQNDENNNSIPLVWQDFWYPLSIYDINNLTLVCLTSVEILAYLTPALSDENIIINKYGTIRVLVNNEFVPIQSINLNSVTNATNVDALICNQSTNCWNSYNPFTSSGAEPATFDSNNYILFVIIGFIILIFVIVTIYYFYLYWDDNKIKRDPSVVISAPK
jgi:hypothetical protein